MKFSRKVLGICGVTVLSIMPLLQATPPSQTTEWHQNFSRAQARAKRLQRPVLLHFYADWCGPCQQMERDVLTSSELAQKLKSSLVGVKIDADKHPDLLDRLGVSALPTDIILSPDGQVLSRNEGYQSKRRYLSTVARIEAKFQRSGKTQIAKNQNRSANQSEEDRSADHESPKSEAPKIASPDSQAENQIPLGLDGYSPVALWNNRKWIKGKPEFAAEHKEVRYHLASAEELKAFRAKPSRYAPRLLGCDPVILSETDRALEGNTKYGAFYHGSLFLFRSNETRERFKKNPTYYTQTRHVLRIDEIQETEWR